MNNLPLSTYNAQGVLRQDPGDTAQSLSSLPDAMDYKKNGENSVDDA